MGTGMTLVYPNLISTVSDVVDRAGARALLGSTALVRPRLRRQTPRRGLRRVRGWRECRLEPGSFPWLSLSPSC